MTEGHSTELRSEQSPKREQGHTKGPWHCDGLADVDCVFDEGGKRVAMCRQPDRAGGTPPNSWDEAKANARRIVACVNACEGIPAEILEIQNPGGALHGMTKKIRAERDLLKEQIKELREALEQVTADAASWLGDAGGCDHSVGICMCSEIKHLEQARAVLQKVSK